MMKSRTGISILVLMALLVTQYGDRLFSMLGLNLNGVYNGAGPFVSITLVRVSWLFIVMAVMLIVERWDMNAILQALGLKANVVRGLLVAFVSTLPMLIGYAILSRSFHISLYEVYKQGPMSGFMEEVLYRGFIFGLLYRRAGWGFIPAVLVPSLFFGMGHLYQSHDPGQAVMIFLVTFAGSVWFAWTYVEWDYNLWVPIGLHFFMNLWWSVFQMGHTALGGTYSNILRAGTIAIAIGLTVRYRKRKGGFRITRGDWFTHRELETTPASL